MYKLDYLPIAKKDMEQIIFYICYKLKNNKAAFDLINEFKRQEKNILTLPYGPDIYQTSRPLKYEYRRVYANNFQIFYYINEDTKTITVVRVIYNKRNIEELLN